MHSLLPHSTKRFIMSLTLNVDICRLVSYSQIKRSGCHTRKQLAIYIIGSQLMPKYKSNSRTRIISSTNHKTIPQHGLLKYTNNCLAAIVKSTCVSQHLPSVNNCKILLEHSFTVHMFADSIYCIQIRARCYNSSKWY